jgi:hypothetical protein
MNEPRPMRYIALIGALEGKRRAAHTDGYPMDPAKMLPLADVVLLLPDGESGAMLFRYTAHGDMAGDTWHLSMDDAREQAAHEYEGALEPWIAVPGDVADAHEFASRYALDRLNSRDW